MRAVEVRLSQCDDEVLVAIGTAMEEGIAALVSHGCLAGVSGDAGFHRAKLAGTLLCGSCPDMAVGVEQHDETISGKIRRVQLRAEEAERRGSGTRGAPEFFEEKLPRLRADV